MKTTFGLFVVQQAEGQSREAMAQSREAGPQSRELGAQSHQVPGQSHQLPKGVVTIDDLPRDLATRIPASGQHPPRDRLRALIIDLCRYRAMSARELASLLGRRDHKPLIRDHLRRMIEANDLAYTIPAMPHHPDQAYTVPPAAGERQESV